MILAEVIEKLRAVALPCLGKRAAMPAVQEMIAVKRLNAGSGRRKANPEMIILPTGHVFIYAAHSDP